MKLTGILREGSIVLALKARDKWEAIDELLEALVRQRLVRDAARARADLIAREKKMSTGMQAGLALPHAKTEAVNELTVAVGLAPGGLEFDSVDGQPARAVFLLLSRVGTTGPHIQCLAEIASLYGRPHVREALFAARTARDVLQALGP